ncbi:MAG: Zn-ribbon domain-containing OB-fold protein [Candidatus Bathyarchaeota archaeon]|nr:Zn-ribbon domain-containing OB-fold protein [Candidatus Bathyarchaeum tardum]WGM88556.1 MAG: Zn-ribbon domain-containing OB-fold protein [Candidatus Bathyarchaeum tardum]WNZ29177.1 MAG: Zn-ribbon domain-containing OB-fold protein [Candidatus Bathyarchaeota archaeon]
MSAERPFTISSFYKFVTEKKLMAVQCDDCQNLLLPPKPMCTKCFSINLKWIELENTGTLLSYTVIHVAPEEFQSMVPYIVGIVEFENGLHLPGIIRDLPVEQIKIGMKLKIDFDPSTSNVWPEWNRYFFRPV